MKYYKWKQEFKKLKKRIIALREKNAIERFNILNKAYKGQLKFDLEYTMRDLAIDFDMNEQTVYKILKWNDAPPEVKKMVLEKKLNFSKAVRICYKISSLQQLEVAAKAVEEKMTFREIDKYLTKREMKLDLMNQERDYTRADNITNAFFRLYERTSILMLSAKKAPDKKVILDILNKMESKIKYGKELLR